MKWDSSICWNNKKLHLKILFSLKVSLDFMKEGRFLKCSAVFWASLHTSMVLNLDFIWESPWSTINSQCSDLTQELVNQELHKQRWNMSILSSCSTNCYQTIRESVLFMIQLKCVMIPNKVKFVSVILPI